MADEPPSEVVTHHVCEICECDIPLAELFEHKNSCVRYRPALACGRCGHGGYIGQREVNKHNKRVHHGNEPGAPGCKNIYIRAAVPSCTERFGGKLVCGEGLKESEITQYVARLQMLHQAGGLYNFQQFLKQATMNRTKLYELADKIRIWCFSAHNNNRIDAAAELETLGLGIRIGKAAIYISSLQSSPHNTYWPFPPYLSETPRDGEIHEHPEIKRHERRFHSTLINRLRQSNDPNREVFRERRGLGDYDIAVISKAISRVQFSRIVEENESSEGEGDDDAESAEDEAEGMFPFNKIYIDHFSSGHGNTSTELHSSHSFPS